MKWLVSLVVATLMATMAAAEPAAQRFVTIGTGGVTGVYYPAGGAICRLLNKSRKEHGIRCSVESTAGSIYNLNALRAKELDFAIVQSDWQYHAYQGSGESFQAQGPNPKLRAVFALHPEPFTLVVRRDAGIASVDDLKGKRVNIGNPGSGQRATLGVLMEKMGWDASVFKLAAELKASEQAAALCDNKIDAMIYVVGHPSGAVQEATTACDSLLVPVNNKAVADLLAQYPYYRSAVIPAGLYRGTEQAIPTFGVGATLVTSEEVPDDVVYALVKSVFEDFDNFQRLHPAFMQLDKASMVSDSLSAPLHPGALKYYREAGLVK